MIPRPPSSALLPAPTLFRSIPVKRSPPVSFKRLLGSATSLMSWSIKSAQQSAGRGIKVPWEDIAPPVVSFDKGENPRLRIGVIWTGPDTAVHDVGPVGVFSW